MYPKLTIIIVHYKTPQLTAQCLFHIFKSIFPFDQLEVIVVDNNSQDDAGFGLTRDFPEIKWIESPENVGFGRANNLGIAEAQGEFILLLNSDVILKRDTLTKAVSCAEGMNNLGVMGCRLLNEDGSTQKSLWYHVADFEDLWTQNLILQKFFPKKDKEIKGIGGAFMLIPKMILDRVGSFDPDFFMYSEELELCYRIRKAGFKLEICEEAEAFHLDGGSGGGKTWSARYKNLSNALLYYKTQGVGGYLLFLVFRIFNTVTNAIAMWAISSDYRNNFWQGEYFFYSNFVRYLAIPFLYSRKRGKGNRQLRLSN